MAQGLSIKKTATIRFFNAATAAPLPQRLSTPMGGSSTCGKSAWHGSNFIANEHVKDGLTKTDLDQEVKNPCPEAIALISPLEAAEIIS